MPAKVTPLRVSNPARDLGDFKCESFNLFEDEEREAYAALRTAANNASKGIKIEQIREYSRKTTVREGSGADQVVTTTDDIILVVQYWEKQPTRKKEDNDDAQDDTANSLSGATDSD